MTTAYHASGAPKRLTGQQERLAAILQGGTDIELLLQSEQDAYFLYHLSQLRRNLLDWIALSPDETVLELDGQTGVLTTLLAEHSRHVTTVVTDEVEAWLQAIRCERFDHVAIRMPHSSNDKSATAPSIYNDDISSADVSDTQKDNVGLTESTASPNPCVLYDMVTLIGARHALYDCLFSSDARMDDAYAQYARLLALAHDSLRPGGRLLLAVNNRLGLQYLSGKIDACCHQLYDTLQNDVDEQDEYCLSKPRLETLLTDAGFTELKFYYPTPDYLFPTAIYSDSYLPAVGELRPTSVHYGRERYQLFDERKVFDSFCEEGLYDLFANSYLVIAKLASLE